VFALDYGMEISQRSIRVEYYGLGLR